MIERIIHKGTVIAIIIHKEYKQEGIKFLSPVEYTLQLGYVTRPKGYRFTPHIHRPVRRHTVGTQEVLIIKKGEVRINFYSFRQKYLSSRKLSGGDIVLFVCAGHSIEVLKKAAIVEIKNGPFIEGADKGRFEDKRAKK